MSSVDLKTWDELKAMNPEQLAARLRDVVETLKMMRKERKRGYINPPVYKSIKRERKQILRLQRERKLRLRRWRERVEKEGKT